jgi:hypothetical protein
MEQPTERPPHSKKAPLFHRSTHASDLAVSRHIAYWGVFDGTMEQKLLEVNEARKDGTFRPVGLFHELFHHRGTMEQWNKARSASDANCC